MSSYKSYRPDDIDGVVKVGSVIVDKVVKIEGNQVITKKVVLKIPKQRRKKCNEKICMTKPYTENV